jgi:DNA-directed RNA polymerase specialized sigma24 family protein
MASPATKSRRCSGSMDAVKTRIHRGRLRLSEALGKRGF